MALALEYLVYAGLLYGECTLLQHICVHVYVHVHILYMLLACKASEAENRTMTEMLHSRIR